MPALLGAAERHLRVGTPDELRYAVTRSHLDDGRCVGWYGPAAPGWRVAIDAERATAEVPPALAARFGPADFWARWTRAESLCKLAEVPVAAWWRRHGLAVPPHTTALLSVSHSLSALLRTKDDHHGIRAEAGREALRPAEVRPACRAASSSAGWMAKAVTPACWSA
ncbi:hypothetical protein, partial [Micromonospora humida]